MQPHRHATSPLARRAFLAALLAGLAGAAPAARIADQSFDERIQLAGAELVLNGVGLRQVAWLKGYAAALYLAERAASAAQVLALPGPKRLQMKMLIDVDAAEFVKAFDKGMRRNHAPADYAALQPRIAAFDRAILGMRKVAKGDVVDLDFVPGTGLVLARNGRPQGMPLPGDDLYAGILRIFVGEHPVDAALRAGLLGSS